MSRTRKSCLPRIENLEQRLVLSAMPTAQEQYMLELINEARTNPTAAAERIEATLSENTLDTLDHYNVDLNKALNQIAAAEERAPVGWDPQLAEAADSHSKDLIKRNTQSHYGPNGETLSDRIEDAGYKSYDAAAENVMANSESVDQAVQAFLIDWNNPGLGHRKNILQPDASQPEFTEAGLAVVPMAAKSNPFLGGSAQPRVMVTQVFAAEKAADPKVLGVVYEDGNSDKFYTEGEGISGAKIKLVDTKTGDQYDATSWTAGGYQVEVPSGTYLVSAEVEGKKVSSVRVDVADSNVKVDFDLSNLPVSAPKPATPATPSKPTTPTPKPATTTPAPTKATTTPTPKPVATPAATSPSTDSSPAPASTPSAGPTSPPTTPASPAPVPQAEPDSTPVSESTAPVVIEEQPTRSAETTDRPSRPANNLRGLTLLIRYRAAVTRRFLITADAASDAGATTTAPTVSKFTSLRSWRA
jgi:uncharacterized protein YkwD